ncbi:SPECTRIN BETA CHAIN BRAIN [Salix koriyanagi]|uniref:SPECTRIN BETA CHAIN BRAIN n=1 Tax=Salix koriyanagi TaxID=2511006 RepID=A0A9Q0TSV6_9ROSI|nr:SPECTRIN BETA CHAIN BRAIN [Salix koriyanagi]
MSPDMPPFPQCVPLEPITLGNPKYNRSMEVRRVLGVPHGSASEDRSFGVAHPKPMPPVATEELKHFKQSVKDTSRKARDRAKLLRESLSKLERYREALSSKKRQRSELSLNEKSNLANVAKAAGQIHRNPHDIMTQRLEDKTKSIGLNKRVRNPVADVQADGRSTTPTRQQMVMDKGGDMLQDVGGGAVRFEEKIRRLPAGGSQIKILAQSLKNELESGPLPRDSKALSEHKAVTKGTNKSNIDNLASTPITVIKAKVSRASRTESIMLLDSSLKVHSLPTSLQGLEQPTSSNKVPVPGVVTSHRGQISAGSSSRAMAKWVGQRPHKNSRSRRANVISPGSNHIEAQISSQGFLTSDSSVRTSSIGTNGSMIVSNLDTNTQKFKRELESLPSPFGLSESEESGAGENKPKDKGTDSSEVSLPATQKVGTSVFPTKKNKSSTNESGESIRRQGRSGQVSSLTKPASHPVREKLENLPAAKPLQNTRGASDKNKGKTGHPPSKKMKDRKALMRVGLMPNSGESGDDREELFSAANSAWKASDLACSGPFWKKMDSVFASVSLEDLSYLKQQLTSAQGLYECFSQMLGTRYDALGAVVHKKVSGVIQAEDLNQESFKTTLCGRVDMGSLDKGALLYQRVLSALIEEEESEEFYMQNEPKNMSLNYASDDSHCSSCNLIDIEPRDRDRMESEVESKVNFQTQKACFLDRLSCDKNVISNAIRNPNMSGSLHINEQWPVVDDDFSHSDAGHASEMCSNDPGALQMRGLNMPGFSSSDGQYQLMCLDERLLLELQSIGLCPETLPDLAEGEVIKQNIMELKEGLHQQIGIMKNKLGKLGKAVHKGRDMEKRNAEQACCGNSTSKSTVRKVSRQVALAFIKRTLARCHKFEDTGSSCFNEPALQQVIFSAPRCNNTKSVGCVGSGTARNTRNEVSNIHAEARGLGVVSSTFERYDSHSDNFERSKKKEVLIDDVIGSASSRVTTVLGGVKGRRNDRDREQSKDNSRSNSVSGASHSSLDGVKGERRTKSKANQKSTHLLNSGNRPRGSNHSVVNASNKIERPPPRSMSLGNIPQDTPKEVDEPSDFPISQLNEFDATDLGASTDLGGPHDLGSWLNIDEDGLQGHDSIGLEIPMDDLMELSMLM